MSKPRFKMVLKIDTLAHAATIRNSIVSELAGKDIFEEHGLSHYTDSDGLVVGIGEWRFNNEIDRDAIKDWIKGQVNDHPVVKNWVSDAKLSWHRCTHDDSQVSDCGTTDYFEWKK